MSHSTFIEVTVGMTTVSYTYGTGSVADAFGVYDICRTCSWSGQSAIELIEDARLLPRRHMFIVMEELDELKRLYDEDLNYLKSVWVKITRFD